MPINQGNSKKIVLIGAGLANSLIALYLKRIGFEDFILIEKSKMIGGKHTWSFFTSDISRNDFEILQPILKKSWNSHKVYFPSFERRLHTPYNSIRSELLHDHLSRICFAHQIYLQSPVAKIENNRVILEHGQDIEAELIFDSRPKKLRNYGPCGYQKFFGMDLLFEKEHGLKEPILMDARCDQQQGYRFFYVLPWSENQALVEDTYYSNTAEYEVEKLEAEVLSYAEKHFGSVLKIEHREDAALPIPWTEQMFTKNSENPYVIPTGMAAGFFQPVTGYSFPLAVKVARAIAWTIREQSFSQIKENLIEIHEAWQKTCRFYFILNKMMFGASTNEERYRIFAHFYSRLPEDSVGRFYSGEWNNIDKLRILSGRPPVSVSKALKSLFS